MRPLPASPPSASPEKSRDRAFERLVLGFGALAILLAIGLAAVLVLESRLAWSRFGVTFLWGRVWDPVAEVFGALPFIYGTLASSAIALAVAVPLGLGAAIFLAEVAPQGLSRACAFGIELLAALPSVVIGLVGIFVLVPLVRRVEPFLDGTLGFLPLFRGAPYGVGLLSAGLILSIMVLPFITNIARDLILTVPASLREGALALGATRWELLRMVVLPHVRSGLLGAVILALGRALGETMAVTMVIGNTPQISASLLDPAYSMAAVIANEFTEATSDLYVHALVAMALTLFGITLVVNTTARMLIHQAEKRMTP